MAGPIPPVELVWVMKSRLSWGAPRIITSQSILIKGITAISAHNPHKTKKR